MKYDYVFYDWNGTLLNDTDICVDILNTMLTKRGYQPITKEKYLDIFSFPIKEYYKLAGFDFSKEEYEIIAQDFAPLYNANYKRCSLYDGATYLLKAVKNSGIKQIIISATELNLLNEQLKFFQIDDYFDDRIALDNYYAYGKIELAKQYVKSKCIDTSRAIMIGDTIHDAEVADEIGCECVLLTCGHQSENRLATCNKTMFNAIKDINNYILR